MQCELHKLTSQQLKDVAKAADFVRNDLPGLERELANVTQSVNQKYHLYLVVMIML